MPPADWVMPQSDMRLKFDSDRLIKSGFMLVIALYLIVTLALPLYTMLSKSFVTYSFDLTRYEFQVSDKSGTAFGPPVTAAALNESLGRFGPEDLHSSSEGRLAAVDLFPEFSFRSPVRYRLRATAPDVGWLVGLNPVATQDWQEYDGNSFRRISLRPVTTTGLQNYTAYFSNPTLFRSIGNSLLIASITTVLTVTFAFGYAYALNRSRMRFKPAFKLVAMLPILVPSLLPGIALIYLFGNQGILKDLLMGQSIYGPLGIVIGSVFFTFPHAMIIITTALAIADQRHYEAADALRASPWRTFWTVTIPGARYGLISAAFVTFTLVITDFGLPKVVGGQYSVLAIDIYKQVIGQQNFEMGAVVSVI
ncbi:ABC transporter permease subunit, partial [Tabrizicola sp.]|uniref:ABC transporter permease subunit n=1 Tax=Tabrizicola sp. TaxID=2005166 RepID=UPI0035ADE53D